MSNFVTQLVLEDNSDGFVKTLKSYLGLLIWLDKAKEIILKSVESNKLPIGEFLRSPFIVSAFETKELLNIINQYPETEKLLPLYQHLAEVNKLFELQKVESTEEKLKSCTLNDFIGVVKDNFDKYVPNENKRIEAEKKIQNVKSFTPTQLPPPIKVGSGNETSDDSSKIEPPRVREDVVSKNELPIQQAVGCES